MKYLFKLFTVLFVLFVMSQNLFSQEHYNADQLVKEYSYYSIQGIEMNIKPSDFFLLNHDGSFDYNVDDKIVPECKEIC